MSLAFHDLGIVPALYSNVLMAHYFGRHTSKKTNTYIGLCGGNLTTFDELGKVSLVKLIDAYHNK